MIGMSATSGALLDADAHLAQSIADILSTPIGTRVMRRDYGSLLFELIDAPFNAATRLKLYAAVADALARWEPRIRLSRITIAAGERVGSATLAIEGTRLDTVGAADLARLSVPLRIAAIA